MLFIFLSFRINFNELEKTTNKNTNKKKAKAKTYAHADKHFSFGERLPVCAKETEDSARVREMRTKCKIKIE